MRHWIWAVVSVLLLTVAAADAAVNVGTHIVVPAAARGEGESNSTWVTDLYIFNPGTTSAVVTVYWLVRNQANLDPANESFTVAAGATLVLEDLILSTFSLASAGGALGVISDRPVAVSSRIYNLNNGATFGQGFAGIPLTDAVRAGGSTDVVGLAHNSRFRTNVVLMDATGVASSVELRLRGVDGTELASATYDLDAWEPKLFAVTELDSGLDFDHATLHAEVSSGAAVIVASKIDNDPASGDPTTLEPWISAKVRTVGDSLLALTGGGLIDGNGGDPVSDAVVIIEGKKILFAGPAGRVTIPTRATTIDVGGHTILPGFFNTHVHEASYTAGDPEDSVDVSRLAAWAWEGVTTVRDVTAPMSRLLEYKRAWWAHEDPRLARLLSSGPCFEVPGGRAEGYNRIIIRSEEDARLKTEQLIDAGADLVKLYFEDGSIFGEQWNVMTLAEARAIVGVAQGWGKMATVHVQEAYLVEQALDAGVNDICHSQVDELVPDHLIQRMVSEGVSLVPTLEMSATSAPYLAVSLDNLERMVDAGVCVAMGTDYSASFPIAFDLGMPMREIELMQRGGMTPMQIIVAGTKNSAHVCGLENELGTVERGKTADLIVVEGNPLDDLSALRDNLRMVIHYGQIIRNELPLAQGE